MKTLILLTAITAATSTFTYSGEATKFTAHEWGTFTSVQGADGVQLEWNPFTVEDLPAFVYSSLFPAAAHSKVVRPAVRTGFTKARAVARQRMETPVIYFYADKPVTVDVGVRFPGGQLTEWYPALSPAKITPSDNFSDMQEMQWSGVEVLPGTDTAGLFPTEASRNHYYAARATDAAPLRVKTHDGVQYEKFLFYRGVGSFVAPLHVAQDHEGKFRVRSTEKDATISDAFFYRVDGGRALVARLPKLDGNAEQPAELSVDFAQARPLGEARGELGGKLRASLVAAGLFEKEAAAMVKTWDDSWFGEQGTRILYVLPRKWADKVLPLSFAPAPEKLERVFVGRAEIFTPPQEWSVLRAIVQHGEGRPGAKAALNEAGLGRFADAVVRKLQASNRGIPEFSKASAGLLETLKPAAKEPTAAPRVASK